jgi:superkiller protein 3
MHRINPCHWLLWTALGAMLAGCGRPGDREFAAGVKELQRGRVVRAKDLLDKAIQLRPGHAANAEAYNFLGMARHELGEVDAAARAFEESRRLNPQFASPSYNLGCLQRRAADPQTALAYFAEASRLDPEDPRPLEMMGRIHAGQKRWDEAAAAWQVALERDPGSARILASLAEVELQRHGSRAAALYLMKSLEADKRYAPALYNLYVIHAFALGNPEEGEPYARRFLEAAGPDDTRSPGVRAWIDARRRSPEKPAPAAPPAGTTAPPPAATASPPRPVATSAPPAAAVAPAPQPARLIEDARRQAGSGKAAPALALCLQAADLAQRSGDAATREKALRAGVELAPDLADAHLALGRLLLERKDAEDASRLFSRAIALAPNNADAHFALAEALIADDDHDAAVLSLRKVLQIRRDDPEARWKLAALYDASLGLKADAIREYSEFVNQFPQDPRALKAGERLRALQPTAATTSAPPPAVVATAEPAIVPAAPAPAVVTAAAPVTVSAPPSGPPPVLPISTGRRIEFRATGQSDIQGATTAFNRGYGYHRRGDLDRAIYDYLRAVEMDNRYVLAFYNLGDVYRQRGDLDLARDAYSRALEISPEDGAIRYNLALVLDLLGEATPAQQQLKFILARQPDHAAAHYMLGLIYTRDPKSAPAAKAHLQKFLELQPSDGKAAGVKQWLAEHP